MKIKIIIGIWSLLSILSVCEVRGANWVPFEANNVGDVFYYDKESINNYSGNIVRVWDKEIFSEEGKKNLINVLVRTGLSEDKLLQKGYDKVASKTNLIEINCKDKTAGILSLTYYYADGSVLETFDLSGYDVPRIHINPESAIEKLHNKVCRKSWK